MIFQERDFWGLRLDRPDRSPARNGSNLEATGLESCQIQGRSRQEASSIRALAVLMMSKDHQKSFARMSQELFARSRVVTGLKRVRISIHLGGERSEER